MQGWDISDVLNGGTHLPARVPLLERRRHRRLDRDRRRRATCTLRATWRRTSTARPLPRDHADRRADEARPAQAGRTRWCGRCSWAGSTPDGGHPGHARATTRASIYATYTDGGWPRSTQKTGHDALRKSTLPGPTWMSPVAIDDDLLVGDCAGVLHDFDSRTRERAASGGWPPARRAASSRRRPCGTGWIYVGTRAARSTASATRGSRRRLDGLAPAWRAASANQAMCWFSRSPVIAPITPKFCTTDLRADRAIRWKSSSPRILLQLGPLAPDEPEPFQVPPVRLQEERLDRGHPSFGDQPGEVLQRFPEQLHGLRSRPGAVAPHPMKSAESVMSFLQGRCACTVFHRPDPRTNWAGEGERGTSGTAGKPGQAEGGTDAGQHPPPRALGCTAAQAATLTPAARSVEPETRASASSADLKAA